MSLSDPTEVRPWLDGVDWPATKEAVVDQAERNNAPDEVVSALQAMPRAEYEGRADVVAAVPSKRPQSDAEKADERRHHTHSGLSEKTTETPGHPIADELGENRGS